MSLIDPRPLKDQFADRYVYSEFCQASTAFQSIFKNLAAWQAFAKVHRQLFRHPTQRTTVDGASHQRRRGGCEP